jgi:glutaminyl-tRNA synthetase
VEDNLAELEKMRSGEYPDGHCVLRAKISLDAANMKMRDPPLYRIRHETHQRTGDTWCIYPMYDYAHPLSDAFERITHSICTLEFQDNREIYDWVVANCPIPTWRPRQYEMARLKLGYTMMSKRRLLALVEEGLVDGWDDPRMPTLSGMRRLGVPAEALKDFVTRVGVAKADSLVDVALLEHCIRDTLNEVSPRVMAVLDPLEVLVDGLDPGTRDAALWPHDVPREGSRELLIGPRVYIERADFSTDPPRGFRRLAVGETVRLRHGAVITCTGVETEGDRVVRVLARVSQDKPRGTLHWVSAAHAVKQTVRLYDRLFTSERPDAEDDFRDHINPRSLRVVEALVEPYIAAADEGTRFQFERVGYFIKSQDGWNRTVGLKDGFKKKAEVATKKDKVRIDRSYSDEDLAAAAPFEADGVGREEAVVLGTDEAMVRIYRDAVAHGVAAARAAKVVVHEVRVLARNEGSMDGSELAAVVKLVDNNTLSSTGGKQVLDALWSGSETPDAIVARLGLAQNSDTDALGAIVDKLFAENPGKVEALRTNPRMMGFFVGGVMKATGGKANPKLVNQLVRARLG